MPSRRRSVEIEVVVDDKRARAGLKGIDGQVETTGRKLSDFAKIAAGAFAADKVVEFGRQAIQSFSDLNESTNAVKVTFGEAADGVLALGKNAAESVGLANSEFNELAVGFSAFVEEIAESSGGDVVGVIDDLTGRISDFASVMNLDVPEAAEKFRSGLAGETEPLRKFGIDVSAAAVNQKALELNLGDASGKLTEQEKILARYELIMDQTEKTAGDFAATSDDLANKQRILQARLEDTQAGFGEKLAPAMEAALDVAEDLGPVLAEGVAAGLEEATDSAAPLIDLLTFLSGVVGENTDEMGFLERAIGAAKNTIDPFGALYKAVFGEEVPEAAEKGEQATKDFARGIKEEAEPAFFSGGEAARREFVSALMGAANWAEEARLKLLGLQRQIDAFDFKKISEIITSGGLGVGRPIGFTGGEREANESQLSDVTWRHQGGMVPGTPGSDQLIMAQAGERISRRAEANGHGASTINYNTYHLTGVTSLQEQNELARRGIR